MTDSRLYTPEVLQPEELALIKRQAGQMARLRGHWDDLGFALSRPTSDPVAQVSRRDRLRRMFASVLP